MNAFGEDINTVASQDVTRFFKKTQTTRKTTIRIGHVMTWFYHTGFICQKKVIRAMLYSLLYTGPKRDVFKRIYLLVLEFSAVFIIMKYALVS